MFFYPNRQIIHPVSSHSSLIPMPYSPGHPNACGYCNMAVTCPGPTSDQWHAAWGTHNFPITKGPNARVVLVAR